MLSILLFLVLKTASGLGTVAACWAEDIGTALLNTNKLHENHVFAKTSH